MNVLFTRAMSLWRLAKANIRIARAASRGDTTLSFGPSSLNLMMIDSCNSQCIMCGQNYRECGSGEALTLEKIKTIYSNLDMRQVVDVIYGGGGEPFLNPELAHIAEYTHRKHPVIQHTVITNMIAGKPNVMEKLLRSRVNFLISVNATNRQTFQAISGVDVFDEVVANIRQLAALRKKVKAPVNIFLSMILMKQNITELCDFIRLAAELGVDGVKTLYARIYPESYRYKKNRGILIHPEDSLFFHQEESDKIVLEAEQTAKQAGLSFCHEPLFCLSKTRERKCNEPWKSLFINYNGDVFPCAGSEILFKHKIDSGKYNSGNILEKPITEIWNNEFWQALRKTNVPNNREEIIPECSCCGNSINWCGSNSEKAHIMDWKQAEECSLRI